MSGVDRQAIDAGGMGSAWEDSGAVSIFSLLVE